MADDGKSCLDIDECSSNVCQHICENTNGDYECSCHTGYKLSIDNSTCKGILNSYKIFNNVKLTNSYGLFQCYE